jgi:CRP-like cAMP-binding protein
VDESSALVALSKPSRGARVPTVAYAPADVGRKTRRPRRYFGEVALLDPTFATRTTTARSVGYSELMVLGRDAFNRLCDKLCRNQIFNTTSMCAYATVSTQGFRLCFESSTRAIDSSKNQPNRLRFDRDREF